MCWQNGKENRKSFKFNLFLFIGHYKIAENTTTPKSNIININSGKEIALYHIYNNISSRRGRAACSGIHSIAYRSILLRANSFFFSSMYIKSQSLFSPVSLCAKTEKLNGI